MDFAHDGVARRTGAGVGDPAAVPTQNSDRTENTRIPPCGALETRPVNHNLFVRRKRAHHRVSLPKIPPEAEFERRRESVSN